MLVSYLHALLNKEYFSFVILRSFYSSWVYHILCTLFLLSIAGEWFDVNWKLRTIPFMEELITQLLLFSDIILVRRISADLYQLSHVTCPLNGRQVSKWALIANIVFPYCTSLCDVVRIFSWKFPLDHCHSVSCNFLCLRFYVSLIRMFQPDSKSMYISYSTWY
jgi:hypothetical protein